MRILIGGSSSKLFHLKEFGENLKKQGVEYKLVHDVEIQDGFPSRKIKNWIPSKKKFEQLIKEFKPDVILVDRQRHFAVESSKEKIPLIIHLRGDSWSEFNWAKDTLYNTFPKKIILNKWIKMSEKTFEDASLILPICKYLEKIVKQHFPDKKVEVMYQGIDPSRWHPKEGMKLKHPCIGLVQGAVIWGKAQEMFVLQKVLEEMPDVTFYWAGDGQYREKILPVLNKYDNFKWLGNLEYPDKIRQFLTEIDVYALVSGIDMSPLTLLEAQLMKKPVVATNVGGIPELMKDNETGFLVEKGDSVDLIKKLTLLTNDEQKREVMGNAGRKFVEDNFSWKIITKNIIKKIEKMIQNECGNINE